MRVDGPHVALVNDRNQIDLRRVTLGRDLGTRVMVIDGIRGGERMVVNPSDDLTNGLVIQVHDRREPVREVAQRQQPLRLCFRAGVGHSRRRPGNCSVKVETVIPANLKA